MSFAAKHPLKTEAVAAFAGLGAVLAGVSTWLTDSFEPWAQGLIAGGVAFVVALIARVLVWSSRSVDELQGNHLSDDEITEAQAHDMNLSSPSPDLSKLRPGEAIVITGG